ALQGFDPLLWAEDSQVLLGMLDEDLSGDVQRSILRSLFQLPLDDQSVLRMVEAARKVGNPTLLDQLHSNRADSRRALSAMRKAVWIRYFGPQAMALVQDGPAFLGSTRENKEIRKARMRADLHPRIDSEADYRSIELATYWIDKLLVTNAEFAEF